MSELVIYVPQNEWLSANDRLHWAEKARRTRELRSRGAVMALRDGVAGHQTTHVAAFIGYLRGGRVDPANSSPTVKALIDGMVDACVWPDDDDLHVIGPTYLRDPKTDRPGHYRVRFVLTEQEVPW